MLNNTTDSKLHEMKQSAMASAFQHQNETDGFTNSLLGAYSACSDANDIPEKQPPNTPAQKAGFSEPGACLETLSTTQTESWSRRSSPASAPATSS